MNRQQRRFQERQEKKLNKQSSINNAFNFLKVTTSYPDAHNTFGHEVSNDYLNINQMKILKKIGLEQVLKITRRKKGMTSSGIGGSCHGNVYKLVNLYGGQQLQGYVLKTNGGHESIRCLQLMWHSVWITPEGEVIDPTKDLDDPTNEKEYTYFSPVYIYQDDGFWIDGENLLLPDDLVKKGFYICERDFGGGEISPYGFGYVFPLTELSWRNTLHSNLFQSKEERLEKTNEHLHDELGGFTEPSSYNKTNKVVGMSQSLTNPQI